MTTTAAVFRSKSSASSEVQHKTKASPMANLDDKINTWIREHLIPRLASSSGLPRSSWDNAECTITTPKGSFFLSDLFFVNIRLPGADKSCGEYLVKMPTLDPAQRGIQNHNYLFRNEIMFYKRLAAGSTDYPKCYFGGTDSVLEYVIVLENVCHRGFFSKSKKVNIELDYVIAGLQAIARFHANTYAVKVKRPDEFNDIVKDIAVVRYGKSPVNKPFKECVDLRVKRATKILIARNYDSDFTQKMVELFDECFSNVLMRCVEPREPLATIVHGDCTINNMLYRRKEKSQELEAMLIDFALMMYCSPATDVSTFIYMSCSREDIKEHHNNFFKAYHDCLAASLKDHGIWDPKKYSYDAFWGDYRDRMIFGYITGVYFLPMMTEYDKNNNLLQLDREIVAAVNLTGGGAALSEQLVDMLIDMREAGLLDAWT